MIPIQSKIDQEYLNTQKFTSEQISTANKIKSKSGSSTNANSNLNTISNPINQLDSSDLPISRLTNHFYFGSADKSHYSTDDFVKLKIDAVIDCTGKTYYSDTVKFRVIKFSFDDSNIRDSTLLEEIDQIYETICNLLANQQRIYIQCTTGNFIAPAIVIYYLMQNKSYSFDDALESIIKIRPQTDLYDNITNELKSIDENFI